MCTTLSKWLFGIPVIALLLACGGDLTLPEGGPPTGSPPPDDRTPAQLLAISGNGQEAETGKRLDDPLTVRLTDQSGRAVSGMIVEFRFRDAEPEAELKPAAAETNENGEASVEVRLGSVAGEHQVEAVFAATNLQATFDLTALERRHGGRGDGDDDDEDD
jgi:hypothetical protein